MGTAKRERQKANRQLRLEEMAKEARTKKTRKRALLIGIGLPVLVAFIFLIAFLTRDDSDDAATATTLPVTSEPVATDPATTDPATTDTAPVTVTPVTLPAGEETPCPAADGSSPRVVEFAAAPPMCIDPAATYTAEVTTNFGSYTIALDAAAAPNTVNNFVVLARYHYFDNTICHRAITGFMVQCGDPTGTGNGGPGYEFANENPASNTDYVRGAVAMANAGQDTNGSQFFVTTSDSSPSLETNYSLFGQVTDGLDTTIAALDALGDNPAASNGIPPSQQIVTQTVTITES